jgi:hypothetical protein
MKRYPSGRLGQVLLIILIGCAIGLTSLVHTGWAMPDQSPDRQSVPTFTPTTAPTNTPSPPTSTPMPQPTPTATEVPYIPITGGGGTLPHVYTFVSMAGGLATLVAGLWLEKRRH